jgi:hypothetical protein
LRRADLCAAGLRRVDFRTAVLAMATPARKRKLQK